MFIANNLPLTLTRMQIPIPINGIAMNLEKWLQTYKSTARSRQRARAEEELEPKRRQWRREAERDRRLKAIRARYDQEREDLRATFSGNRVALAIALGDIDLREREELARL